MKKKNKEEFISDAIKVHGNLYDYSLVEYINSSTRIKIICNKHGIFEQNPNNHLRGSICKKCSYEKISEESNKGREKFIKESNIKHNNKYDYSLVEYKNNKTKVKIICQEHGIFEQRPDLHLYSGCIKCVGNFKKSKDKFIEEAKLIHGDKYDYSLVDYKNNKTPVKIICKKHGMFEQIPSSHLKGCICEKCSFNYKKNINDFLKSAFEVHGDNYIYDKSVYKTALTKLIITCKKHGDFSQTPNKHIGLKQGCPKCKRSKGVELICKLLDNNNIRYENEKTIKGCVSKNNKSLYFDIFIDDNIAIEYDGEQHFIPIENWGGVENLKRTKERDLMKNKFCEENNIKLFRISYFDNIEEKMNEIISSYLQ